MNLEYPEAVARTLRSRGVECAPGLSASEIENAEAEHGFRFPPDLRAFLESTLPVGKGFPNWRLPGSAQIRESLEWPAHGLCFDVEFSAFWLPAWGPRPESLEAAQARAREAVRAAPMFIPIFGHRYLPASPSRAGNAVFSVYQTDIICYGFDLPSYVFAEFGVPNPFSAPYSPREIDFWSELERRDE